ncbi:MAG TPA: histidine kinase [Roseiflexaceae bacterium]|nr:histidine kinase [Roseiflexaceae bacterium]
MDILFAITMLIFVGLMLQLYLIWSGIHLPGLWAETRRGPPPDTDVLLRWRQDALTLILTLTLIFGTPLAIADSMLMLQLGRYDAVAATVIAACFNLVLILGRRIPFPLRAGGMVAQIIAYGVFRLFQNGLIGSGRIYLLTAVVMAALLLGWRSALASWLVVLAVFSFLVVGLHNGTHVFVDAVAQAANPPALVLDNILLVLWFAATLGGALAWLSNRLNHSVRSTQAIMDQLAAANTDLERRVAEHTAELRDALLLNAQRVEELLTLNRVGQALMSWTDVRDAIATVSGSVGALFDAYEIGVWQLDDQQTCLTYLPTDAQPAAPRTLALEQAPMLRLLLSTPRPLLLPPDQPRPPLAQPTDQPGNLLVKPLLIRNKLIGLLYLHTRPGRTLLPADVALLQTIAGMVASALDNARLLAEAEATGAANERQRLARDLHDSVNQALFAASVTADVIPQVWELDPEEGQDMLGDVRRLTRSALAEMRTLLLELRPTALAQAPLRELLEHLVVAARAKQPDTLHTDLTPLPALPPEVRVALYRIAQEALANIVKHAEATAIWLRLRAEPPAAQEGEVGWSGLIELVIEDNGRGFVVDTATGGGLGLGTMAERATGIGAHFALNSQPGTGTRITVCYDHNDMSGKRTEAQGGTG